MTSKHDTLTNKPARGRRGAGSTTDGLEYRTKASPEVWVRGFAPEVRQKWLGARLAVR